MSKFWNRCDSCGKAIPFADFGGGRAIRRLITPDAYGTRETFETMCARCKEREGETNAA